LTAIKGRGGFTGFLVSIKYLGEPAPTGIMVNRSDMISEIGGGLNFKRKKFLTIMLSMLKGEISTIVVAHKDRMCRFAFELIQELATSVGCEIVVLPKNNSICF
jgi:predicted site-specific integrase-resolvase